MSTASLSVKTSRCQRNTDTVKAKTNKAAREPNGFPLGPVIPGTGLERARKAY